MGVSNDAAESNQPRSIDASTTLVVAGEGYDESLDDEPPPAENETERLHWREEDPTESLSDWKIQIVHHAAAAATAATHTNDKSVPSSTTGKEEEKKEVITKTYHVHKVILAKGPRRSEYFFRLFRDGGRFAESETATSRINLVEIAAKAFPQLLDYLYSIDGKLEITTENATALHWLGQYFEVRRLRWDALQFCINDMSPQTCGTYYEHALLVQNHKILGMASKFCAEHIAEIDTNSRLLHVPDPAFWLNVLHNRTTTEDFSRHMSKLIAAFCCNNKSDASAFAKLTQAKYLPDIDSQAALALIDLEREIICPDTHSLSNLQKRCLDALSRNWSEGLNTSNEETLAVLQKQNPFLLSSILLKAVGSG